MTARSRAWLVALALYFAVVVTISVLAYRGELPGWTNVFWRYDYAVHGLVIGPLAFLLDGLLACRPLIPRWKRGRFVTLGATIVLALAGAEELLQQLSPRRTTSFADFAGDFVGVAVFALLARLAVRRRGSRGA